MKKKINCITFIILFTLLLFGCNKSITKKDIDDIKNTNYDSVVESLSSDINKYISNHNYYNIKNIYFIEDRLSIDETNEVRKFNNIDMFLEINFDPAKSPIKYKDDMNLSEKNRVFNDFTRNTTTEIEQYMFKNSTIEFARLNSLKISYVDETNRFETGEDRGFLRDGKTMKSLNFYQFESEKDVLKQIFKYIKDDERDYVLQRFGMENSTILIEFNLYDEDVSNAELKDISDTINNLILKEKNYLKDIHNKNISLLKVVFNQEYNYKNAIIFEYNL